MNDKENGISKGKMGKVLRFSEIEWESKSIKDKFACAGIRGLLNVSGLMNGNDPIWLDLQDKRSPIG